MNCYMIRSRDAWLYRSFLLFCVLFFLVFLFILVQPIFPKFPSDVVVYVCAIAQLSYSLHLFFSKDYLKVDSVGLSYCIGSHTMSYGWSDFSYANLEWSNGHLFLFLFKPETYYDSRLKKAVRYVCVNSIDMNSFEGGYSPYRLKKSMIKYSVCDEIFRCPYGKFWLLFGYP